MTKKEIELQCNIAYQEKFLELTGHKVGDEVDCSFFPSHGNAKQCFISSVDGRGIIVRTDKGIFVQSIQKYKKAYDTKMYPNRPLNNKRYYRYVDEQLLSDVKYIKIKQDDNT
jgi:hypothetical protein